MNITKKQFTKAMKEIEKQIAIDLKNHEAFTKILENDFVSNMKNLLYDSMIKLLMELTGDNQNKWIEYFMYELDFGKENWRLQVYDKNNIEIPLTTVNDLWNILST